MKLKVVNFAATWRRLDNRINGLEMYSGRVLVPSKPGYMIERTPSRMITTPSHNEVADIYAPRDESLTRITFDET